MIENFNKKSTTQIVHFKEFDFPLSKIKKRMGYPKGNADLDPGIETMVHEEMKTIETLLQPQGIYRILHIKEKTKKRITFHGTQFTIESHQVAKMLTDSKLAILFMVTIGPSLENQVDHFNKRKEITRAFILDAMGSEIADVLADKLHHQILKELAHKMGFNVTPRFSPGYGDWPLNIQKHILNICHGSKIGITITDFSMLIPRKSVTAVLGFR